jgi:hypothetical protein
MEDGMSTTEDRFICERNGRKLYALPEGWEFRYRVTFGDGRETKTYSLNAAEQWLFASPDSVDRWFLTRQF